MTPAVSIIIPVYNAETFLPETLNSIRCQKFADFEVICVNDGSKDSSLSILQKYASEDPRFRVIDKPNEGAGKTRNRGLKEAHGKYVIFLDSDDLFEPELLSVLQERAETLHAEVTTCCYQTFSAGEAEKSFTLHYPDFLPRERAFSLQEDSSWLFGEFRPEPWKYLFDRTFIEKYHLSFSENIPNAEDVPFTYSALALAQRIAITDRVLVHYRVSTVNSLERSPSKKTDAFLTALKEWRDVLKKNGIMPALEKKYLLTSLSIALYNLHTLNNPESREALYMELRNHAFADLGIDRLAPEDYPDQEQLLYYRRIKTLAPAEYFSIYEAEERQKALPKAAPKPGLMLCLKENGLSYTLKRITQKIREKLS